ncbi:hypothetical protein C8J57DRAFT_1435473 [Mycena rebaudengoi]|nr:hypothetical protein C8J57DRAFT_1435473 [Mycena rebaudengoi]
MADMPFHLPAHIEACNILFSFNLTPFVGQTDGEAPERGWANVNPLAASTKEMGPGSRRDTIDDHYNDWNWKKIIAMGPMMLAKIKKAAPEMVEKRLALDEMMATLPPAAVGEWTTGIELWERDSSKPNPFQTTQRHESVQAIRGRMAVAAQEAIEGDDTDEVRGDVHASEFIAMGLQLEEQQRTLKFDKAALKTHKSDEQTTTMQERTNKLRKKVVGYGDQQVAFSPEVARLQAAEDQARAQAAAMQPTAGVEVHEMELWLPSKMARTPAVESNRGFARYEFDLRIGQAHEALEELRKNLLVRTHLYKTKDKYARSVAANTCANNKIKVVDERVRQALEALGPVVEDKEWKTELKPLSVEDVRSMPRAQFSDPNRKKKHKRKKLDPETQARRKDVLKPMSWIWIAQGRSSVDNTNPAMDEALRLEWAKMRAKSMRWTEEVDLLEEEMRRVLQFLAWRSDWWRGLIDVDPEVVVDLALREGFAAYAHRQARVQDSLQRRFTADWTDVASLIATHRTQLGTIPGSGAAAETGERDEEEEEEEEAQEGEEHVPAFASEAVFSEDL